MWNALLMKFGFFLLSKGANMLAKRVFGVGVTRHLETLIEELSMYDDLTGKQKYNRAKKFLDSVDTGAPEALKNLVIEAAVSKVTGKTSAVLKKVQ